MSIMNFIKSPKQWSGQNQPDQLLHLQHTINYANFYLEWKSKYHTSQFGFFYDSQTGKDTDTLQIGNLPQELTNQMWQLMW